MNLKTPPNSIDTENSILASCLTGDAADICELLTPESFYTQTNKKIFSTILKIVSEKNNVDTISVVNALKADGSIEKIGGAAYLMSILDYPVSTNIEYDCSYLKQLLSMRTLIEKCSRAISQCYLPTDPTKILDDAQREIMAIETGAHNTHAISIKELCLPIADEIEERKNNPRDVTGVPSGFHRIDKTLRGFQDSDFIILAARPGMGKTAAMLNMMRSAARNSTPTAIFSLEMSKKQLAYRSIAQNTKLGLSNLFTGQITDGQLGLVNSTLARMYEYQVYIDDTGALNIMEFRRRLRTLKREKNIRIAYIDYLQLMTGDTKMTRDREVAGISAGLKNTAKELDIPIVALSQLNRNLENRPNKRPRLSDLRDSGTLEQDADVIMFLYRDEPYIEKKYDTDGNEMPEYTEVKNKAEINIAKHRNGPTGVVHLAWLPESTSFENISGDIGN